MALFPRPVWHPIPFQSINKRIHTQYPWVTFKIVLIMPHSNKKITLINSKKKKKKPENTKKAQREKNYSSSSKIKNKAWILTWEEKICHADIREVFLPRFNLLLPH